MKAKLANLLPLGSLGRWIASGMLNNPICFLIALFRSFVATRKLTGHFLPLRVRLSTGQRLLIKCNSKAKIILNGNIIVNSWGGSNSDSSIACFDNSNLTVLGDFEIGPNVHIELAKGAKLSLGGKVHSSASGITCNTRIMVEDSISIGADCIIAWDIFISDSNWHEISGVTRCSPVIIGNNVWISHGVSILKGAVIPAGCIVGAKSLVTNVFMNENVLIAGIPAKVIRTDVEWIR